MASLSERLKRERELRGISLKQISEETRIGVRFLEALEEGKLDVIPGEFYRRSYLRSYARYLGLDEDRAVNAYDYSRKEKRADDEDEKVEPEAFKLPLWLKWVLAALGLAIPAVLLLRAMPAATDESAAVTPIAPVVESRAAENVVPMPIRSLEPPATREPSGRATSSVPMVSIPSGAGPLRLAVLVDETCWLEIQADGEVALAGLKEAGYQAQIVARQELRLWLGNAGGVRLVLNGQSVKSLGERGDVRKDLTITTENVQDFIAPETGRGRR